MLGLCPVMGVREETEDESRQNRVFVYQELKSEEQISNLFPIGILNVAANPQKSLFGVNIDKNSPSALTYLRYDRRAFHSCAPSPWNHLLLSFYLTLSSATFNSSLIWHFLHKHKHA